MRNNHYYGLSENGFHRIVYSEWGEKTQLNIPTLCVHGLTRNRHDFDGLSDYLASRDFHLFCPDIVGRGDSDWLSNPMSYTYEQYLADVNGLICRINADHINWIGTSMGGIIGLFLASLPNSPIQKLVLNDVGAFIAGSSLARLAKYAGTDPDFNTFEDALLYFKRVYADFGTLTDAQWHKFTEDSIFKSDSGKFKPRFDQNIKVMPAKSHIAWRAFLHPLKTFQGNLFDVNLWSVWQRVQCPVLIIHGRRSDILTHDTVLKMKQFRPNVEVVQIEDAGHAPALLDIAQQQAIYEWLIKP